ncbi:MAG: glycoside hydrolase family 15 protein [Xanthobacteraceae bacterium]|nr:MAG: glycoside hydrolase family 15 protein [Xanthobacteraceae bacterium]
MNQQIHDHGLDLAVIGNGATAALVNPRGRILWWCFPRFDSEPVFCRLVSGDVEHGFADVVLEQQVSFQSEYLRNSAVVTTTLTDSNGAAIRITDFAPRFYQFGRTFRPPHLVRIIEPVSGLPRITVRVRPVYGYGEGIMERAAGSNHLRFSGGSVTVRLTTDMPLSFIDREASFVLTQPIHIVIGSDMPVERGLEETCREFRDRTLMYWREWVRRLAVPPEWQDETIRAAITLKLCSYEETGAVVAALTTSIPESPGSGRNWDYRYCWLRDAYFVVQALNMTATTRTMENFISYILTAVLGVGKMKPVYGVVPSELLVERLAPHLAGYRGSGPVRIGNDAAIQDQHDAYGSIILAAAPMFFDHRLPRMGTAELFHILEPLGEQAAALATVPDAGIWEYRGRKRVHTHSAAMCWAGCRKLAAIAQHLNLTEREAYWHGHAKTIREAILQEAWSAKRNAFTGAFGEDDLDASVLLLAGMGLVSPEDPRFISTVMLISRELSRERHVMRYVTPDDFGPPESAFLICRFWLIDALALIGRQEEARAWFVDSMGLRNSYGLLAEDVNPSTGALWGNFPQTYSMAGLILTAFHLARNTEERPWQN